MNNSKENVEHGSTMRAANTAGSTLARLDELDDYEVADGEPDIRGWEVKLADGTEIGEVEDLIVDPTSLQVRYMDIEVDGKILGLKDDDRVIVPIGAARLDDDDDTVFLDRLPSSGLRGAPRFGTAVLTAENEMALIIYFFGDKSRNNTEEHSRFMGKRRKNRDGSEYLTRSEERLAVGKRSVKQGEVNVSKSVETEHVKREVPTRHEEVTVERRPLRADGNSETEIGKDQIRIPVMGEEVVMQKRTVPVEEVVITKKVVTGSKTVEADLKREKVNVDRTDKTSTQEKR